MNKTELAAKITEKTGLKSYKFVNAFIDTITDALARGEKVQLVGFGTFETRKRNARVARNPKTGGTMTIPTKIVPAFKAGKTFKEAVNK